MHQLNLSLARYAPARFPHADLIAGDLTADQGKSINDRLAATKFFDDRENAHGAIDRNNLFLLSRTHRAWLPAYVQNMLFFMENFGERLRAAARRAGYPTDAKAAKWLRIEVRTYGNYVNGRVPDSETLTRICRSLGTSPDYLFGFRAPGYQQEAAAIAEKLEADDRGLWFRFGRSIIEKMPRQPSAGRRQARRAS